MSRYRESRTRNDSTVRDRIREHVPPTIRARADTEGCGCLECRDIETATTRRTALDALLWSVRLFRSHPSIVALGAVVVLARRLLEANSLHGLPTPAVGVLGAVTTFSFVFPLRAYVATIVAGELTGTPVTVRDGLRRSIARVPAFLGMAVLILLAMLTIPFVLSLPLFALLALTGGAPIETFGFPLVAAVGGVGFAVPFLFLLFRFWFAPEACVVGRYGPIESLRISWRITTNYRAKLLLIVLLALGSALSVFVVGASPDGGLVTVGPLFEALSTSAGEFLSILWAGAYAHLYVQGVVDV